LLSKGSQKLFISRRSSKANFPKRVEEGGKEKIRPLFYLWLGNVCGVLIAVSAAAADESGH